MAALPYMQLYVAEYLADTSHLNAMQHGAYMLLLMNYWQRGKALPDSNDRLAIVARMSDEEWNANRDVLAEFFQIADGCWKHKRVEIDLARVKAVSEAGKKAGIASGKARKQKTSNERSQSVATIEERNTNQQSINRTEQNRTERAKDPEKDPSLLASIVLAELSLSGTELSRNLTDVCRGELAKFRPAADLRVALVTSWLKYQACAAEGKLDGKFTKSAAKFFGEGVWANEATWPWKPGAAPQPKRPAAKPVEIDAPKLIPPPGMEVSRAS